jgi:single-strand DNA-binding protein
MSVSVSVAVNKRKPDGGDSTTWFKCSVWGTQAETIDRLVQQGALRKGSEVFVSGSLEAREYQDRNGQTRQSLDVFVNTLQLTGSREANDNPNAGTEPKDGVPF